MTPALATFDQTLNHWNIIQRIHSYGTLRENLVLDGADQLRVLHFIILIYSHSFIHIIDLKNLWYSSLMLFCGHLIE